MRRCLLLAMLLTLPLAAAHDAPAPLATLQLAAPEERVQPGARDLPLDAKLEVSCVGNGTLAEARVRFAASATLDWLEAHVEPARVDLAPTPCDQTPLVVPARVLVNVSPDAPAFLEGTVLLDARIETPHGAWPASAQAPIEVDFVGDVSVTLEEGNLSGPPQTPLVAPLRIANHANGAVKVSFELLSVHGDVQVPMPAPVTLQGTDGTQREKMVPLTVQTPHHNGRVDEDAEIVYRLRVTPALDPTRELQTIDVPLRVHTEGWYIPAPALAGVALALAGAALVGRRAR